MNVNYDKLWMLMAQRGISKTDICDATGISTRTMAKLSKNESVTIDTLGKICEVLNCDISDIVSFSNEPSSIYDAFKKNAIKNSETEYVEIYDLTYMEQNYLIYITKRKANKLTKIELKDNDIKWRQISKTWMLDGSGAFLGEVNLIARISPPKDKVCLFILSGKPGEISGLDDGIFRSARNFGGTGYVNVMSEPVFKCFSF